MYYFFFVVVFFPQIQNVHLCITLEKLALEKIAFAKIPILIAYCMFYP